MPVAVEYGTFSENLSSLSSYNFASLATPGPGLIVVSVVSENSVTAIGALTPTSVTIGGVSATLLGSQIAKETTNDRTAASLWSASGVTGTTATIAVNYSGAQSRCIVGTFRVTGQLSDTPAATSTSKVDGLAAAGGSGTGTASLTFSDGAAAIYVIGAGDAALSATSGGVDDFSGGTSTTTWFRGGRVTSAASSTTVSATFSSNAQGVVAIGASWASPAGAAQLASAATAQSTMTGALSIPIHLASSTAGVASMTATLTAAARMSSSMFSAAAMVGSLTTQVRLAGQMVGVASMTATLSSTAAALASTATATATLSGTLRVGIRLTATAQAAATFTGSLTTASSVAHRMMLAFG